jgi:CDP-4-dehydro-6-deoxyglucose reductase, E1
MTNKVLYAQAVFGEEEKKAVLDSLENTFLSVGALSAEFEQKVATLFGKKYGVFVNSGSSANLLVTQLIPKGEVITPALTFATTLTPILQAGLTPIFVDSEINTFLPTIEAIRSKITPQTTAVMIPNLLGNKMDSLALRGLCDELGLLYIEDSCDTITQTNGHFVTTSFYGSHIITAMGGGGMVMSSDKEATDRIRTMRDWGRGVDVSENIVDRYKYSIDGYPYDGKFWYTERGFNMRPIEAQAAFGLEQLKRFPTFEQQRKDNFNALYSFFKTKDNVILPQAQFNPNWLAYPLLLKDTPFTRFELVDHFEQNGIQTRPIFSGNVLRHPAFHIADPSGYPNADYVMRCGLLLGIHQGMGDNEVNYITTTYENFTNRFNR